MDQHKQNQVPLPVNMDPNLYYINNIILQLTHEELILQILSGNQLRLFAVSIPHAKRIVDVLKKQIDSYESGAIPKQEKVESTEHKFGFNT